MKLLPSLTDFAFLMPIFFLFGRMDGLKTLLGDCDTGWHIRTGEWILAHHGVPTHDIFSFSKPDGAWYAWEWLTDVIWAFLNSHGGLAAVAIVAILLIALTIHFPVPAGATQKQSHRGDCRHDGRGGGSSVHWLARPHLFTLFFLVLFYGALENVRDGKTRFHGIPYLVVLPLTTILWTNLHGGFFVGIIMIGAYGAGEILRMVFSPGLGAERDAVKRQAAGYLLSAAACLAASLVNPYAYHLHAARLAHICGPLPAQHIMEFLSLSFHHPMAIFFESMLLLSALASFWFASKGRFTEPLLLMMWAHAALLAARNIPHLHDCGRPRTAAVLQVWLDRLPGLNVAEWLRKAAAQFQWTAANMTETDRSPAGTWSACSGSLLVAALLFAPHPPQKFRPEFDPKVFRRRRSDAAQRPVGAHLHPRPMGRLSDLPAVPEDQGVHRWPQRFLRRRFRRDSTSTS